MGKKHNQDATAVENILALYTFFLANSQGDSLTGLTRRFNVSKPTMLRYLQQLEKSEFGKIQLEKRGREHFYSLERPKDFPKLSLSALGLQQLALCRDFMAHLLPLSIQRKIDATLQQATAYLPSDAMDVVGKQFADVGESFSKGRVDYAPFESMLKTLIQAIKEQNVCSVVYQKDREVEPNSYDYAPQKLISYNGGIYIRGFKVTDKGAVKPLLDRGTDLLLHRFKSVELTRRSSEKLPQVPEIAKGAFGYMDHEPFTVKIKFATKIATYIAERIWSDDQEIEELEDGSLILTMTARNEYEITPWIMNFTRNAEALEPEWLREKVKEAAKDVALMYGG